MEVEQSGVPAGWEVVEAPKPAAPPPPSTATPVLRSPMVQGGRGSQLTLDRGNRAAELAVTPLAHPTGIDAIDSITSPVGIASAAAGGVGIMRAFASGGVGAAAAVAAEMGITAGKFEITHRALRAIGVPDLAAAPIAAYITMKFSRGMKAPDMAAPAAKPSGYLRPSELPEGPIMRAEGAKVGQAGVAETPRQLTQRLKAENAAKYPAATSPAESAVDGIPPAGAPAPSAAPAGNPPASVPPPTPVPASLAPSKLKLSAAEMQVAQQLAKKGWSDEKILSFLRATKSLSKGLPSDAEVQAAVKARNESGRWPQ